MRVMPVVDYRMAPVVRPVFGSQLVQAQPAAESQPYGAIHSGNAVSFKLWAPAARQVDLVTLRPRHRFGETLEDRIQTVYPMTAGGDGGTFTWQIKPDTDRVLYMYRLKYRDGKVSQLMPDYRSRYQPEDVHGPSQVVNPQSYHWQNTGFKRPADKRQFNIYEMHMGTFTPQGTFASATASLDEIKNAGYNMVKVMPIKEFAGKRNWGYDMVGFFATENAYGTPNDFKRFVDECHKRGLAVVLDVVYNHIGPEGNYFKAFDRKFTYDTNSPWGDQFNWQNPQAAQFVRDNLTMWLQDFKVDGFRFDMTSFINDDALRMMNRHVKSIDPTAILIAEDGRSSNHLTLPLDHGGAGYWGKWNFAFHHATKSLALGETFMDVPPDLKRWVHVLENGFEPGAEPINTWHDAVTYFDSHDEVGNYDGLRTNLKIPRSRFVLMSMMKLLLPGMPMTFMGEEYGERNPFYFFADYADPACIKGMREGRKNAPQPDAMLTKTFMASKLSRNKDAGLLRLNQDMNRLRQELPAMWQGDQKQMKIDHRYLDSGVLPLHRWGRENPESQVFIVANLKRSSFHGNYNIQFPPGRWQEVLNTNDARYGGIGDTNAGKTFSAKSDITVAPHSIAIFKKS